MTSGELTLTEKIKLYYWDYVWKFGDLAYDDAEPVSKHDDKLQNIPRLIPRQVFYVYHECLQGEQYIIRAVLRFVKQVPRSELLWQQKLRWYATSTL